MAMHRPRLRVLASLLALAGSASAALAGVPVPADVEAEARANGHTRVIVVLAASAAPTGAAAQRAEIARQQDAVVRALALGSQDRVRRYDDLPLLAFDAGPRQLDLLSRLDEVRGIEPDRLRAPSLLQTIPLIGADATTAAGFTGTGAAVAILDSGVDAAHPFLTGRVVAEACFSLGDDCPNGGSVQYGAGAATPCTYSQQCFHGTHVAGIAAGVTSGRQGVAPDGSIVAVQVFSMFTGSQCAGSGYDPCAMAFTSDLISAMSWVRNLAGVTVAAANLSLGSGGYSVQAQCDASESAFKTAIDALLARQILTFAAAGNDGDANLVDGPACVSSAVAVGSVDDNGNVWTGSNSGVLLDLLAPGWYVVSSVPTWYNGTGYASASGTSMATPHASGAAALLRGARPDATAAEIRSALEGAGVPVLDPRNGLTRPRLAAVPATKSLAPAACYDALDNDGDGAFDYPADSGCASGVDATETPTPAGGGCGIGVELALVLPLLAALRARRA
jgi:hypothetical protein